MPENEIILFFSPLILEIDSLMIDLKNPCATYLNFKKKNFTFPQSIISCNKQIVSYLGNFWFWFSRDYDFIFREKTCVHVISTC